MIPRHHPAEIPNLENPRMSGLATLDDGSLSVPIERLTLMGDTGVIGDSWREQVFLLGPRLLVRRIVWMRAESWLIASDVVPEHERDEKRNGEGQ